MFIAAIRGTRPIKDSEWEAPQPKTDSHHGPGVISPIGRYGIDYDKNYFAKHHSHKGRKVVELIEVGVGVTSVALGTLAFFGIIPGGLNVAIPLMAGGGVLAADGLTAFVIDSVRGRKKARYKALLNTLSQDGHFAVVQYHKGKEKTTVTERKGTSSYKKKVPKVHRLIFIRKNENKFFVLKDKSSTEVNAFAKRHHISNLTPLPPENTTSEED